MRDAGVISVFPMAIREKHILVKIIVFMRLRNCMFRAVRYAAALNCIKEHRFREHHLSRKRERKRINSKGKVSKSIALRGSTARAFYSSFMLEL